MSTRISGQAIAIPQGVDCKISAHQVEIKGPKGLLTQSLTGVKALMDEGNIRVQPTLSDPVKGNALAGTHVALIKNAIEGVVKGFSKKLQLVGVGYRAQVAGKKLSLTLGLSHPAEIEIDEGITITTPSATEIEVSGIDKQAVGQFAAKVRNYRRGLRKPEPYKGKGIRYADERIIMKETKKK